MTRNKLIFIAVSGLILFSGIFFGGIDYFMTDYELSAYAYENQGESERMLRLANEKRRANGLQELKLYPKLCQLANIRAKELVQKFDHTRPNGSDCFTVLNDVSYYWAGENIAYNYHSSPDKVFNQWLNSEGHRNNILNSNATHIGAGFYKASDGRCYWVQILVGGPSYSGEYTPAYNDGSAYSIGDADGNGTVDAVDASIALTCYAQMQTGNGMSLSLQEKQACDVNQDGVIDSIDASQILGYYAMNSTGKCPYFSER